MFSNYFLPSITPTLLSAWRRVFGIAAFLLAFTLAPTGNAQIPDFPVTPVSMQCDLTVELASLTTTCDGATVCFAVAGGMPPYTFSLTGTIGTPGPVADLNFCFQNLAPGTYALVVADVEGCSVSLTFTVPPIDYHIDGEVNNVTCHGGADGAVYPHILIDIAPLFYNWEGPGGFTSDAPYIENLEAGVYSVSVTTIDNVCVGVGSWEVVQPDPIGIEVAYTTPVCGPTSGCIFITGGTQPYHVWILPVLPTPIAGSPSGSLPDISILDPNAGFPVSPPTSNTNPSYCFQNIPAGTYYVLVVDANLCYSWIEITIQQNPSFDREVEVAHISCHGANDGSICFEITGGTPPYVTFLGPATSNTGITGPTGCFADLAPGAYILTTTDGSGCTFSEIFYLHQPAPLTAEFIITTDPCDGPVSGCLKIQGGTTPYEVFVWTWDSPLTVIPVVEFDPDGNPYIVGATPTDAIQFTSPAVDPYTRCAQNIPAGLYLILVLDTNGCYKLLRVLIPEEGTLGLEYEAVPVSCAGNADGAIKLKITGGQAPYTIVFNGTSESQTDDQVVVFENLDQGVYTIEVSDANQCSGSVTVTIDEPDPLEANLDFDPYGSFACVDPSGGTPPYAIRWINLLAHTPTGIGSQECVYNLPEGVYLVIIRDAAGCTTSEILFIDSPPCVGGEASVDPEVIESGESTTFTLSNWAGVSLQWQFRTENTPWLDIPGATTEVFQTPPMHSGSDRTVFVRARVTCQNGDIVYSTEVEFMIIGSNLLDPIDALIADARLFDQSLQAEISALLAAGVDPGESADVLVFPNPASDLVNLRFGQEIEGPALLQWINPAGQVVQRQQIGDIAQGETIMLPVSAFPAGVYWLRINTGKAVQMEKVIIE